MSFRQLKYDLGEKREQLKATVTNAPPVAAVLRWWAVTVSPPWEALMGAFNARKAQIKESYGSFATQEVKREWAWMRHTAKEWNLWLSFVKKTAVVIATLMWQIFIPVSVVLGLLLPMFISYVVYDHPLFSPIGLGLLLISPLKYLSFVGWVWLL